MGEQQRQIQEDEQEGTAGPGSEDQRSRKRPKRPKKPRRNREEIEREGSYLAEQLRGPSTPDASPAYLVNSKYIIGGGAAATALAAGLVLLSLRKR